MIEIDNKKMWASLMEQCALSDNPSVMEFYYLIRRALKKQGFDINSETNEIVSIEPEFNGTPIRAGRWYVCDCKIINENQTVAFHRDETYYCPKDGWLDVKGLLFEVGSLNIDFRPATEEEILKAKYGITGIGSKKAEGKLGEMIGQRMTSAKAKEALLNDVSKKDQHSNEESPCLREIEFQYHTPSASLLPYREEHNMLVDLDCANLLRLICKNLSSLQAHEVHPWLAYLAGVFEGSAQLRLRGIEKEITIK